jgi:competence protein ComFC
VSLTYWLNQLVWGSLDWLFPPVCGGCNRPGFRWCPDCRQQVHTLPEPVCRACGLPIPRLGQCPSCKESVPPYVIMRSWLVFEGPIRQALHNLKYRRNMALGDALAQHLEEFVDSLGWPIDMVVPVPLGKERIKERGYNQVGLVARPLAAANQWRYTPRALVRSRETKSQVGLTPSERKENVAGAFQADVALVSRETVLLIDDVATTGATVTACTTALLDAGAMSVYVLTLARALPHHGLMNI